MGEAADSYRLPTQMDDDIFDRLLDAYSRTGQGVVALAAYGRKDAAALLARLTQWGDENFFELLDFHHEALGLLTLVSPRQGNHRFLYGKVSTRVSRGYSVAWPLSPDVYEGDVTLERRATRKLPRRDRVVQTHTRRFSWMKLAAATGEPSWPHSKRGWEAILGQGMLSRRSVYWSG